MLSAYFAHHLPYNLDKIKQELKVEKIVGSFCHPDFNIPSELQIQDKDVIISIDNVNYLKDHKGVLYLTQPLLYFTHPLGIRVIVGSLPFVNKVLSNVTDIKGDKDVLSSFITAYGVDKKDGIYVASKEIETTIDTKTKEWLEKVIEDYPFLFPQSSKEQFAKSRDYKLIDNFKDDYLHYPHKIIQGLKNKEGKIMFSITSCKRLDLFKKTVNSFINCCQDINLISYFLCVDDNSSDSDKKEMESLYPFFTFVFKGEKDKGHVNSMNIIRQTAIDKGMEYLIHIEDDWHFFDQRSYIEPAINILKVDKKYGQVLFNLNYYEVPPCQHVEIAGGIKKSVNGLDFVEHEYYSINSPEERAFRQRMGPKASVSYWPHYSFRPSVINVAVLQDIGPFYQTCQAGINFEMAQALEYTEKGYKSVFFDAITSLHIGKKTWERGTNSYALNKEVQFYNGSDIDICVLSESLDNFLKFKNTFTSLPHYRRCKVNMYGLTEEERILFQGNEFAYDQRYIAYIKTFLDIIRNNKSTYILILHDKCLPTAEEKRYQFPLTSLLSSSPPALLLSKDNTFFPLLLRQDYIAHLLSYISTKGIKSLDFLKSFTIERNVCLTSPPISLIHEEMKGFQYYGSLDHFGDDITCVGSIPVREIAKKCRELKGAAFNTLGYIKRKASQEKDLKILHDQRHGIYIVNH